MCVFATFDAVEMKTGLRPPVTHLSNEINFLFHPSILMSVIAAAVTVSVRVRVRVHESWVRCCSVDHSASCPHTRADPRALPVSCRSNPEA